MTLVASRQHSVPGRPRTVAAPNRSRARRGAVGGEPAEELLPPHRALGIARRAWPLQAEGQRLLVRGAQPTDLAGVAAMHGRCSGQTLLQRYRVGGRAPSLPMVAQQLREPLVVVVLAGPRQVVALGTATLTAHPRMDWTTEIGLLVEDAWQQRGIGSTLAQHLGAVLRCLGYGQVSTRSATTSLPLACVMERLGDTRSSSAGGVSTLTTRLEVPVAEGLCGGSALAQPPVARRVDAG